MNILRSLSRCIAALIATHLSLGGVPELPVFESADIASVTAGINPEQRISYFVLVIDTNNRREMYFNVDFGLVPTNSAALLRAGGERIEFQDHELVSPGRQIYRDEGGWDGLGLSGFDQAGLGHGAPWRYIDVLANAPRDWFAYQARSMTDLLLGYRFPDEDGLHYGWMRFARSETTFTNIFDLVAHDWHPIPGAAISAGQPPEVPLITEVADDGAGGVLLRVSWHPAVATWIFETTNSLIPPVTWTEYPAGGTSAEIPLDGEEPQRYFRLRRP